MAIILWVCISSPPPPPPRSSSLINYPVPYLANNGVCEKPEPTVRIIGRDGLCVDVRDSRYNDGNPIQVSPCSTTNAMNQQWSLRTDGTIRSGGKCLTASRNTPGSTVVIHDCNTALAAATRWQLSVSGTMMHQAYGLVLSANSRGNGATLTLERDISSIAQGWRTTNNLQPFVTSIYGMMNLCLEANGAGLRLQGCASNRAAQMWALYPDGSIRPQQNQNNCMACASLSQGASIRLESCAQALTTHRWVFTNDGTIMHLQSRLVMEVRNSNPSLGQFIISPSNGNANQKWLPSL